MSGHTTEKLTLEVTRMIRASRERVFEAFSSVEELKRWFCPGECYVSSGEMEFTVGGGYLLQICTPLGDVDLVGAFVEIVRNERMVYTWEWKNNPEMASGEMLVAVDLADVEGGTEVKITHQGLPGAESLQGHREGWDGSFDKLDRGCRPGD